MSSELMSRHEMGKQITILTNRLNEREEAIQRVRDLHNAVTRFPANLAPRPITMCNQCQREYPCPTIRAVDGEQA